MIISRSNNCPHCGNNHANSCYIVYESGTYCFSCNTKTFNDENQYVYRPVQQIKIEKNNVWTPKNTTNPKEFSTSVLKWLYKYYVYDDLIRDYKIAFVGKRNIIEEDSLLFCITNIDGEVVEYQRRFFPSKRFYSTTGVKRSIFVADKHNYNDGVVTIVEDYISAIRVGCHLDCLCLFGTLITDSMVKSVHENYSKVLIWLDNDSPGIAASSKIRRIFEQHNINYPYLNNLEINILHTEKQPKEYTDEEISQIINKA